MKFNILAITFAALSVLSLSAQQPYQNLFFNPQKQEITSAIKSLANALDFILPMDPVVNESEMLQRFEEARNKLNPLQEKYGFIKPYLNAFDKALNSYKEKANVQNRRVIFTFGNQVLYLLIDKL